MITGAAPTRQTSTAVDSERVAPREIGLHLGAIAAIAVSTTLTAVLIWWGVSSVAGDRNASWILGRASGLTSYLLFMVVVLLGLGLAHPAAHRWRRPAPVRRIGLHLTLSIFALAFLVLHIVVLATDRWAGVGWWGAFVPMGSTYRPVPITLGVICTDAALVTAVTALGAGRWARRIWWPVHKVAAVVFLLAWGHGVLAGSDAGPLWWFYLLSGLAVIGLAISRYTARTPRDELAKMISPPGQAR